jgi:hypothetical protein
VERRRGLDSRSSEQDPVAGSSDHGMKLCIPQKARNVFTEPLSGSHKGSCSMKFVTDKKNEIKVKDIAVIN